MELPVAVLVPLFVTLPESVTGGFLASAVAAPAATAGTVSAAMARLRVMSLRTSVPPWSGRHRVYEPGGRSDCLPGGWGGARGESRAIRSSGSCVSVVWSVADDTLLAGMVAGDPDA